MLSVPGVGGGPSPGFGPGEGGSGAGSGGDFLTRYRLVSAKLRRRFLRKPNVSEAAEQFGALARELRAQESLPYAAWCQLAVARCAQSLGHASGEAAALGEAARLWLRHDRELRLRQGPGLGLSEHLPAAQSCVAFGARLHFDLGQPALAAGLWLELGNELRAAGEPGEAVPALMRAADLLATGHLPLEALRCLRDVASCLLLCRDHDGALTVLTQAQLLAQGGPGTAASGAGASSGAAAAAATASSTVISQLPGAFLDELLHCEVTRVLLLLLLQPPPSKLLPEHAQTLEKYSWEALDASPGYVPSELFLLLQSAVMACQEKDLEALKVLQKELWPLLTPEQNHILHLVVQEMISPSGQGV
ncbi:Factor VIII intron 22 protein [Varanus komodoensis]|uniref:Factor VIII intron 22 protein n=1 Tax=Varanus komodoensis TaxID=61221 RepID=A0A8D2LDZ0_VARKO|nr:40-kDa huntingtin-associated protein-like [Varanus komodoensis]KAF7244946.1 Factor VIII intron 22 protein [Varanus komodoensis]